ncbi:MAG: SRPBCC family protein [Acidobacteriota bacterium]|nr:SRPBCC family protein [Acidobacteriota bacterium]
MAAVSRTVAATPEAAWELLASTRTWAMWGPSVTAVDPPDATIEAGMHGRVRTPLGPWLPFCITRCDPPRSWAWTVLGIPATTHTITPVPGGCRISFGAPTVALPYLAVCRVALGRIARLLETTA